MLRLYFFVWLSCVSICVSGCGLFVFVSLDVLCLHALCLDDRVSACVMFVCSCVCMCYVCMLVCLHVLCLYVSVSACVMFGCSCVCM